MAIPRIKAKRVEWTRASLIQLGVAGVLLLVSALMIWSAVRKFGLKRNFANALEAHDKNLIGNVKPALESALSWDPEHWWARELLAKVEVDGGADLAAAEEAYRQLLQNELARKETAHYGLGVIALRRADAEKDWKAAEPLVKAARESFALAKKANAGFVEAEIGLRHCDLLALRRSTPAGQPPDREKVKALAGEFGKILEGLRSNRERAARTTREGYIDLFAGLGWAWAAQGDVKSTEEAIRYFKSCCEYAPLGVRTRANLIYLDAQRFAGADIDAADLRTMLPQIMAYRGEVKTLVVTQKSVYGSLLDPWLQYCLAAAYAYGMAGERGHYSNLIWDINQNPDFGGRLEPPLLDAAIWCRIASRSEGADRDSQMGMLATKLETLLKHADLAEGKAEAVSLRAAVLSDLGAIEEHRAVYSKRDSLYDVAIERWKESIRLEDAYEPNRNIAVVQKRRKKPDAEEWFKKALKAGEGRTEPGILADVEKLTKFFGEAK